MNKDSESWEANFQGMQCGDGFDDQEASSLLPSFKPTDRAAEHQTISAGNRGPGI